MEAALDDWRTAPVDERVRAGLGLLERVTLSPETVTSDDIAPLRKAGLDDESIADALYVAFTFNVLDRVADALGWVPPQSERLQMMASMLAEGGYVMS